MTGSVTELIYLMATSLPIPLVLFQAVGTNRSVIKYALQQKRISMRCFVILHRRSETTCA